MLVNLTEYFDVQGKAHLSIPYESEKFFDGFGLGEMTTGS